MKLSSPLAVSLGVLLALSTGCKDSLQPEPMPIVASLSWVRVSGPAEVLLGGTAQLSARAFDQYGQVMSNANFTWRSSDEAIATVSEGQVTGKALGPVTISATTAGKKAEMTVWVAEFPASPWDY